MNLDVKKAIENQNVIEFYYEGQHRIVEPHTYGKTTAGNEGLRAYQVGGYSSSGTMGWKLYNLEKAESIVVKADTFIERDDYRKGDKGMSLIYVEV